MARTKHARATRAKQDQIHKQDNRPWFDRATNRDFLQLEPGTHTLIITGPVSERINTFGNPVIDIPTMKGVLSTGAYALMRPLARVVKDKGSDALQGARLILTVTGEGAQKRYANVTIQTAARVVR